MQLYLIEILHQTTTDSRCHRIPESCILSKFYIKPQRHSVRSKTYGRCILSKFYIKPQRVTPDYLNYQVVSYRNSTSNHNYRCYRLNLWRVVSYRNSTSNHNLNRKTKLFARVVSYRNSTSNHNLTNPRRLTTLLYLIEILHQTTTYSPRDGLP